MPLHVIPAVTHRVGRREFLRGVAAAGAAQWLAGSRFATADDRATTWALISDTHIGATVDATARGQTMAENLRRVVREILDSTPLPGGIVIDGDLALSKGESADYATLLKVTAPLREAKIPLHLTLGNHDHRDHFRDAFRVGPADSALREAKHASVIEAGGARWFYLDSLRQVNETAGELTQAQLDWLKRELDAKPDRPSLVFLHHNLASAKGALADTKQLLELLIPRRQVKAVFFGHTHAWQVWQADGIHLVNLPAVAYVFSAEQPLGWVQMTLGAGRAQLEFRALDPKHKAHRERHELRWRD